MPVIRKVPSEGDFSFTLGALFSQSVRQFLVSGLLAAVLLVLIGYDTVRPYRKWRRRLNQRAGKEGIACLRFLDSEVESFFAGSPSENTERFSYAQIDELLEEPGLFVMTMNSSCLPVFKDSFTIGTAEEFPSFLLERMEKAKQEEKEPCAATQEAENTKTKEPAGNCQPVPLSLLQKKRDCLVGFAVRLFFPSFAR